MGAEIRKHQDLLLISGNALILFGLWDIVKMIMYFILEYKYIMQPLDGVPYSTVIQKLAVIVVFIIVGIDAFLRIFTGLSARKDAKGKKKLNLYIIPAIISITFTVILNSTPFFAVRMSASELTQLLVFFIIDIFCSVSIIVIIVSSFKIRKLRKAYAGGEDE